MKIPTTSIVSSNHYIECIWQYFYPCFFILAACITLMVDVSGVPDYLGYSAIYQNITYVINEPLYVFLNNICRTFGLTYDQFRIPLLFNLCSLLYIISALKNLSKYPSGILLNIFNCILISYVLSIFIFEFFIVRIRAGLAIGLFCIAIGTLVRGYGALLNRMIFCLSIAFAYFVHKSSTVILIGAFGLTGLPLLYSIKWSSYFDAKKYTIFSVLVAAILLFLALTQNQVRTGVVISNLNLVRLIAIGLIPFLIFIVNRYYIKRKGVETLNLSYWPNSFELFYAILAIGLVFLYVMGLTEVSGEALVRLYTLLSFPALIALIYAGNFVRAPVSAYILVVNASFFLATLNLFPSYILETLYIFR